MNARLFFERVETVRTFSFEDRVLLNAVVELLATRQKFDIERTDAVEKYRKATTIIDDYRRQPPNG